ncbi:MAG: HAD family hydrolase [Planctomycetes bacterium]|nr:HAD family hydrolase [Planctomycetota bacterium]
MLVAPARRGATTLDVLLLDLDGTLVDASDAIVDGVIELAREAGLPVPERAFAKGFIGQPPDAVWTALGAPDPLAMVAAFGARVGPGLPARTLALPGVADALAELAARGLRMAVATTRVTASARRALEATGLQRYFAHVVGRDLVRAAKPAPDVALAALAALGAGPTHALFVGDSEADIGCAHAAGMPCWAVLGGTGDERTLRAAGADRILSGGLGDLPHALQHTGDPGP